MLTSIRFVFTVVTLVMFAYVAITFYVQWLKETDTGWQRLLCAARDSATILWAKFVMAVGCLVGQLDNIADFVGMPQAKDFINTWVGNPKALSALMIGIALITMWARTRSGSTDPIVKA